MWQLMLCLLTANIVPAMITALIQNIQELMVPVSGLELGKKEYVSATGLGETLCIEHHPWNTNTFLR